MSAAEDTGGRGAWKRLLVVVGLFAVVVLVAQSGQGVGQFMATPFPGPPEVQIQNLSGPSFAVIVNGRRVTDVTCPGGTMLRADDASLPRMPWSLQLVTAGGTVLGQVSVNRGQLPYFVQVRGREMAAAPFPISGPVPSACP